jgi:hemerythrin superfamily protein
MNAVTLLKSDHRKVERLFERYRSGLNGKPRILREILRELSMHMDAEERELYPVLRTSISDGENLMNEAVKEHKEAAGLLVELERADMSSFDMDAKVATLRRAVEHHVKEEEEEIFPKMEESLGTQRLDELGTLIRRAKRSAPKSPSRSAVRNSPGSSMGGIISAAADRVKDLVSPGERKPARPASRRGRSRKTASRTSSTKTTKKPGHAGKHTRSTTVASHGAKGSSKSRKTAKGSARPSRSR